MCICHGVCCYHVVCVLCLQGPSQLHSLLWIGLTMTAVFFRTTTFSCKRPMTPWWASQKLLLSSRWVCHKLHCPPHTVQRRCCFWCVPQVLDKQSAKPNCSHFPWVRVFHCHRAHADCWTVLADHAGTHQIVQSTTNMLYTIHTMHCSTCNMFFSFLPPFMLSRPSFPLVPLSACGKVSYLSSAPHLSDKSRFPYHVRVEPAESIIHRSQGIIVAQFGWEEVTWIVQNEDLFVSVSQAVKP